MKTKCTRGIIYFIGLIVLALGIVLNTKTLLGVSPIISIPYNICHIWHLNLGAITFVFYCFCVLIEAILKGKEFKLYELLQIPMSLVTSVFINIFDRYLNIVPDTLGQKLLVLFFAIVVTGIGAATMVNMKLVPNPADALAAMIGDKLGKGMGIGKNVFDVTCFCTSGIIGLVFTRHIIGLGIGTVLAVIFTGRVIAVYNYFLKHPMQNLAGITAELESEKEKRKRTLKTKCTRGIIYFIGLIVLALGIVLNTKTLLGVSPIISIPYNICHIWHLNLGAITFVFYCFCVLIEAILKGKEFKLYELLQIPMSLVTSVFINIFDRYLNIVPDTLGQKLLVLFFAIVVTGIGAATMVNMKLVPNPADALAAMIGDKLGKGMGIGKNVFDVTCFCTSGIIGLVFTRHIIGLGIGTVLAVIFTGRVIAVYNYFLKHPMQNLAGITAEL